MVERIPDLPHTVLGFTAIGTITTMDYEKIIMPAVEEMHRDRGKVRFLYHLGDDFSGFQPGAVLDDAKLGLRHLTGWERTAIVTDVDWIRWGARIFGLAIPGQVRVFSNRELDEAKRWIRETS